tara:strand:- start:126 stop:974 length:849 start_codon:yes stop_codon:yes gene_type:complete
MSDSYWDCTATYYHGKRFYWGEHKVLRVDEIPPYLPVHEEDGIGIYDVTHEATCAAMFKRNMTWGINLKKWSHGEKTAGYYIKNKKNGIGFHVWPSGAKFIGQFKNNMPDGPGVMISVHDGLRYVGRVCGQDCIPHDPGKWYDKTYQEIDVDEHEMTFEGQKFIGGSLKDGLPHGKGILRDIVGAESEGEFIMGIKNGPFVERYKFGPGAGCTLEAEYANDERKNPVKVTKILYGDVFESYEGDMIGGRYEGQGRLWYPNGVEYEGDFKWGRYVHPPEESKE